MAATSETGYTPGSYPSASQVGSSISDMSHHYTDEVSRAVGEHPAGALATAFGIGLGLGALVGLSIALSVPKPTVRSRTEEFGQRMLDMFGEYVPESVSRRFH